MRSHTFGCALALAALGATLAAPSTAQVLYVYKVASANAVDLGTLGGDEAEATDINNSGAIVGSGEGEEYRGYIWQDGVRIEVPGTANNADIRINGINATNRVVGATAQGPIRAIYWNGMAANATSLGVLPGGNKSEAFEVNDGNFVAGYSTALVRGGSLADTVKSRAFIWQVEFGMYALPVPPTFMPMTTDCVANSLNNRETNFGLIRVVGYCTKNGKKRAVRWNVFVEKVAIPIRL